MGIETGTKTSTAFEISDLNSMVTADLFTVYGLPGAKQEHQRNEIDRGQHRRPDPVHAAAVPVPEGSGLRRRRRQDRRRELRVQGREVRSA